MQEQDNNILMNSNISIWAYVLVKSIPSYWLYHFATSLDLFLKIFPSLSNLLWKTNRIPITKLAKTLGTSSRTLFHSNSFKFVCMSRDQCSSTIVSLIPIGLIRETKGIKLHNLLRDHRVATTLEISSMTF